MILQDLGAFRRDRAELDQLVERELVLLELADGERGAVERERRHDHVDARAVRQARVADRRGFVDAPADLADDALADVEKLLVVAEADAGLLNLAGDFDVDRAGAVHHDVGDVVARQQRLERAVAEHVVADVVEQLFLLGDRHHDVLDRDDLVDDVADFLARGIGVEPRELREIDRLDQRAEDRALGLVVAFGAPRCRSAHRRRRLRWQRALRRRAPTRAARRARPTASARGRRRRRRGAAPARGCGARRRRRRGAGAARRRSRTRCCYACRTRLTISELLQPSALQQLVEQRRRAGRRLAFFASARPVSSWASCRKVSAVRWFGGHFGDHLAVVGGGAEQLRLERDDRDRLVLQRLGEVGRLDLRPLRHADLVEAVVRAVVVRRARRAADRAGSWRCADWRGRAPRRSGCRRRSTSVRCVQPVH